MQNPCAMSDRKIIFLEFSWKFFEKNFRMPPKMKKERLLSYTPVLQAGSNLIIIFLWCFINQSQYFVVIFNIAYASNFKALKTPDWLIFR